jgi:hypothetical protein
MQILCQNSVVKVSGESKGVAPSADGDMFWTKNATMTNDKMDEKRSALWRARFQVQMDLGDNRGLKEAGNDS